MDKTAVSASSQGADIFDLADVVAGSPEMVAAVDKAESHRGSAVLVGEATGAAASGMRAKVLAELRRRGHDIGGRDAFGDAVVLSRRGRIFVVVADYGWSIDQSGTHLNRTPAVANGEETTDGESTDGESTDG